MNIKCIKCEIINTDIKDNREYFYFKKIKYFICEFRDRDFNYEK